MKKKFCASIDIGGTKISVSFGSKDGLSAKEKYFHKREDTPDDIINISYKILQNLLKSRNLTVDDISAIGVACPGPFDFKSGKTIFIPNMKGWENYPIVSNLFKMTQKKIFIENDANCAAIAERHFGDGKKFMNFVYITISTGIGAGIIINGRIYHGATCDAGEIGHMPILKDGPKCGCGKRGCLEALASGSAITKRALEYTARYPLSILSKNFKNYGESVETILRCVRENNPKAVEIWNCGMDYLARGISNIMQILNPEAIVIGGGVAKSGDLLFNNLNERIVNNTWSRINKACKIIPTRLGDDIVDLGAIALALNCRNSFILR